MKEREYIPRRLPNFPKLLPLPSDTNIKVASNIAGYHENSSTPPYRTYAVTMVR